MPLGETMDARSYFDHVRHVARDLQAVNLRLERLLAPRGQSMLKKAATGATSDPTASRAMSLVDSEQRLRQEAAQLEAELAEPRAVAVGLGVELGSKTAQYAIELYYLELNTWDDIAIELSISLASLYRLRNQCMERFDALGPARLRELAAPKVESV